MASLPLTRDEPHAAHFYVRNLDASVRFYVDTLGFQVLHREEGHALVALGRSEVMLTDASKRDRDSQKGAAALSGRLVVPDVDGVYHRVRQSRVVVIDELRDRASKVHDFVTVDPDGFPIRLSTAV
jgi:catechol 2,3-dioxygenase-like lactoylglutathione lyase family enzyme